MLLEQIERFKLLLLGKIGGGSATYAILSSLVKQYKSLILPTTFFTAFEGQK